jgi:hypothetical protein
VGVCNTWIDQSSLTPIYDNFQFLSFSCQVGRIDTPQQTSIYYSSFCEKMCSGGILLHSKALTLGFCCKTVQPFFHSVLPRCTAKIRSYRASRSRRRPKRPSPCICGRHHDRLTCIKPRYTTVSLKYYIAESSSCHSPTHSRFYKLGRLKRHRLFNIKCFMCFLATSEMGHECLVREYSGVNCQHQELGNAASPNIDADLTLHDENRFHKALTRELALLLVSIAYLFTGAKFPVLSS